MVVCFDPPTNLKSFIQRRGRARAQESRLVMIMSEEAAKKHIEWAELEAEMKKKYEDETREIEHLANLEEEKTPDIPPFRIAKTGAQLDFDQAKSHLEHACTCITSRQYFDPRPFYIKHETQVSQHGPPIIKATVVLPNSFPPHLRRFEGAQSWDSEKNATKDAAFQAFVALHGAGLIDDHLMPLRAELGDIETRAAQVGVSELWNPWPKIARAWDTATTVSTRQLCLVDHNGQAMLEVDASLPGAFPNITAFKLYWDQTHPWTIEVGKLATASISDLRPDQSMTLIDLAYGHRWEVRNLPHVLHLQSSQDLPFHEAVGQRAPEEDILDKCFLVRYSNGHKINVPFYYESWLLSRPPLDTVQNSIPPELLEEPVEVPWVALRKWSKWQDFLHKTVNKVTVAPSTKPYQSIRPASHCRVDGVHVSVVQFGALLPTIIHTIETYLIADELSKTILRDLEISNLDLIVTAISSSAAREPTNYQRFEYLGDSILKLLTSTNVAAIHKFILTKAFTGRKWRPLYVEELRKVDTESPGSRDISTKTLADVVESLIGASFLDGGMNKALDCIRIFIPEIEWHTLDATRNMLADPKPINHELPSTLIPLEGLLGYTFQNKTLAMEAMTHTSFGLGSETGSCMERLEFIGDAILDDIIVSLVWDCGQEYGHYEMSLLRAASVNKDLLGFLMMEWAYTQEATSISSSYNNSNHTTAPAVVDSETIRIPIWKLMRHSSQSLGGAQSLTEEIHAAERGEILRAMREAPDYPWARLAHLQIPKCFSDLFESILGAVWVDSGSMQACKQIAERAGILPYLRRLIKDGVAVAHPKNRLGELVARSGNKKISYVRELRRANSEGEAEAESGNDGDNNGKGKGKGFKEWICRVIVGGELLVEVGAGVSREEIVTKAADVAYNLLRFGDATGDVVMT
ncbi:Dicer-like protein 2 [Diatrype stigma]|uniref:Dicer-like protein 2 n=1 Tax=Diatrype stigma TaxID=117547 RepID=A0AAN9UGC5_9PEZI